MEQTKPSTSLETRSDSISYPEDLDDLIISEPDIDTNVLHHFQNESEETEENEAARVENASSEDEFIIVSSELDAYKDNGKNGGTLEEAGGYDDDDDDDDDDGLWDNPNSDDELFGHLQKQKTLADSILKDLSWTADNTRVSLKNDFGEDNGVNVIWDDILSRAPQTATSRKVYRPGNRERTLSRISESSHTSSEDRIREGRHILPELSDSSSESTIDGYEEKRHTDAPRFILSQVKEQEQSSIRKTGRVHTFLEQCLPADQHNETKREAAVVAPTFHKLDENHADDDARLIVSGNVGKILLVSSPTNPALNELTVRATAESTPKSLEKEEVAFNWPMATTSVLSTSPTPLSSEVNLPHSHSLPLIPIIDDEVRSEGAHLDGEFLPLNHLLMEAPRERVFSTGDVPWNFKNRDFLSTSPSGNQTTDNFGNGLPLKPPERTDIKRSNLKKRPDMAAVTLPSTCRDLCPTNNLSLSVSKKSIKWGTDVPETRQINMESSKMLAAYPPEVSKLLSPSGGKPPHPAGNKSVFLSGSKPLSQAGNKLVFQAGNKSASQAGIKTLSQTTSKSGTQGRAGKLNSSIQELSLLEEASFTNSAEVNNTGSAKRNPLETDVVSREKDGANSKCTSGRSTPSRNYFKEEPGNIITRAINILKGKFHGSKDDLTLPYVDDVISVSGVSSCGGMSSTGDISSRGSVCLADIEDTVMSFDDMLARNSSLTGMSQGAQNMPMSPLSANGSILSDDVFRSASTKKVSKSREKFLPEALKNSLVIILSGMYGILLVVLGLVLPISEAFSKYKNSYFFETFYLYLYAVSMIFLVYVYTYLLRRERLSLQIFRRTISRTLSRTFSRSSVRVNKSGSRSRHNSGNVTATFTSNLPARSNSMVSCSSRGRRRKIAYNPETSNHTGSFYLRVGVIGFGIGSMIHSGLTFGHYFEINHLANHCGDVIQAIKPFGHLCFTFVQMYFVFMNSKMCVHKYKTLARFGLMHMSCTNICVWLRSIVVETLLVIKLDAKKTYKALVQAYTENRNSSLADMDDTKERIQEFLDENEMGTLPELDCHYDAMMGKLVEKSSVYLYPCTIEYSLVCACVLYVMWSNVGEAQTGKRIDSCSDLNILSGESSGEEDSDDDNGNHRMSIDCAGSSRGLFLGIFLFVTSVVVMICYYVLISTTENLTTGRMLGYISEDIIYLVALIATVIAAYQMRNMHFSIQRTVGLEEILTIISVSGLGLYGMFSIVPAIFYLDLLDGPLTITTNLLMLVQAGAQATFTLCALRASAKDNDQLRGKPGRECVTFLLISNFALWAINTFETQRMEHNVVQIDFYGTTAWSIFSHISVPLGIYFRFHSTVNLSIVWKKAWKLKHALRHRISTYH